MEAVNEIPISDRNPEAKYIRDGHHEHLSLLPLIDLPIIDLSHLTADPSQATEAADQKIRSALRTYGCMMITNHGVESWFLDRVRMVFKQFVALPEEEKLKWKREVYGFDGYGNGPAPGDLLARDWSARLFLTVRPKEFRQLKYWPENPPELRELMDEYGSKLVTIYEVILKALARSLNLKETSFLQKMGEPWIVKGRFNFYPSCPRPDLVFGLKPHYDSTVLTVLLQDEELEGLQILKDGQWFRVPIVPGALVINVGEQLEILSNGKFKSLYHRGMVDSERERISLAMLSLSNPQLGVEPIEELVDEERPSLYRKVKYEETSHFHYYKSGRRLIDEARI